MNKKYITFLLSLILIQGVNNIAFAQDHHHHHHTEVKGSEVSKKSIYLLDSKWKTQNNKTVQLKDFRGKPVVVSMLYTTCTKSCPIIMSKLKELNELLSAKEKNNVTFLIISINPEKDTPKVLKAFAEKNKTNNNFVFLSGTSDSVLEIASLLGIRYVKTDDDYSHTNKLLILNKKGEVVHENEGLNEDLIESKKHLLKSL